MKTPFDQYPPPRRTPPPWEHQIEAERRARLARRWALGALLLITVILVIVAASLRGH